MRGCRWVASRGHCQANLMTRNEKILVFVTLIGLALIALKMHQQEERINELARQLNGVAEQVNTVSVVHHWL